MYKLSSLAVLVLLSATLAVGDDMTGNQTNCPIMGGKINPKVYVDYKDNRIFFCCPGCDDTFLKDPEAQLRKMADAGVRVMKLKPQSVCPITEEALKNRESFVDVGGKRIYTCCGNCNAAVEKDVKAALKKIADRGEFVEDTPAANE
jgi:hypothetical protein